MNELYYTNKWICPYCNTINNDNTNIYNEIVCKLCKICHIKKNFNKIS